MRTGMAMHDNQCKDLSEEAHDLIEDLGDEVGRLEENRRPCIDRFAGFFAPLPLVLRHQS